MIGKLIEEVTPSHKICKILFYFLVDPVITGCSSIASSICLKWTLPNDAFNRTRALSLSYHYLYQTGPPLEIALNSTTREKCVGFLGNLLFNLLLLLQSIRIVSYYIIY